MRLNTGWLLPNRYPKTPLASLFVVANHDDDSLRSQNARQDGTTFILSPSPGLYRSAVPRIAEMRELFALSDKLNLMSLRNHPLSGMSLPVHDHWHVILPEILGDAQLKYIYGNLQGVNAPSIAELPYLPYSMLYVKGETAEQAAELLHPILESLEQKHQIWTVSYYNGIALVSPRSEEALSTNAKISFGCDPNYCELPESLEPSRYLPKKGSFDWGKILDPSQKRERIRRSVESLYRPLNLKHVVSPREADELVAPILVGIERDTWRACREYQDKRDDVGHTAVVTYFTHELAKLYGLSLRDREIAILAAILHDTGWSRIEGIREKFSYIQRTLSVGSDKEKSEVARFEREFRVLHQNNSVAIAEEVLGYYPDLDSVISIIKAHDTRETPEKLDKRTSCMWDADVLWRVSVPGIFADYTRMNSLEPFAEGVSLNSLCEKALRWTTPGRMSLQLPHAIRVARIEQDRAAEYFMAFESGTTL